MRFVAASDLHVHAWPAFSNIDPETGLNSRLVDTLRVFKDLGRIAVARKCDAIVIAGDIGHVQRIDVHVLDLLARAARDLCSHGIPVLVVNGNHDQAARLENLTLLNALQDVGFRLLDNEYAEVKGVRFWGRPYGSQKLPKDGPADVAILHQGIVGAELSEYFVSAFEHDLKPDDAPLLAKSLVVTGHYHKHRHFKKGVDAPIDLLIPGAPLQHTWGDAGQDRGLWIAELNGTVKLEFVPLAGYPKFLKVTKENLEESMTAIDGNFVQVVFDEELPKVLADDLTAELKRRARGFAIQASTPKLVRPSEDRMKIDAAVKVEDVVKQYAAKYGGERAEILARLGLEFLKKAEGRA